MGGDTKSCPKEEHGKEEEEGEKGQKKRRELYRQADIWAMGPNNKHMLCLGRMLNA